MVILEAIEMVKKAQYVYVFEKVTEGYVKIVKKDFIEVLTQRGLSYPVDRDLFNDSQEGILYVN